MRAAFPFVVVLALAGVGLTPAGRAQEPAAPAVPELAEPEPAVATVTVTNLMKGQILTPAVFATHGGDAPPLFVPGQPASSQLAAMAERGATSGLVNSLGAEPAVLDVTVLQAFVRPGRSATVSVRFDAEHRLVTSASMIEMTNDGFVSLPRVEIPCEGATTVYLTGWDAGSEANTELCSQIPAPCPTPRRPGSCSAAVEGFVHVHAGIQGCGGFPPETFDWGYPAASATIEVSEALSPAGSLEAACPGRPAATPPDSGGDSADGGG